MYTKSFWVYQVFIFMADDVLIYGRDDADHDGNMEGFTKWCQLKGIKLNRTKLTERAWSEVTSLTASTPVLSYNKPNGLLEVQLVLV